MFDQPFWVEILIWYGIFCLINVPYWLSSAYWIGQQKGETLLEYIINIVRSTHSLVFYVLFSPVWWLFLLISSFMFGDLTILKVMGIAFGNRKSIRWAQREGVIK